MKHSCILLTVILLSINLKAQQNGPISLNIYGGYTFRDKVNFDAFYGYVEPAFQYGAGLEFFLSTDKAIELKYLRMDTHFPLYTPDGTKLNEGIDKGSVNYYLVGGNNYFGNPKAKAIPYAGFDLGLGTVASVHNSTHFAWDFKLGAKLKSASNVCLKIQAYIQSVVGPVGTDFYTYPDGTVVAVPDYASIFQFGLGAAVDFNFKSR